MISDIILSKFLFILLLLFPTALYAQITFAHEKEVARLYHEHQYEKAWSLLLKIEDKDSDSPYTYKTKGTYHSNASFYYYVARVEFYVAMKRKNEKLFKSAFNDMYHLCRISTPEYPKTDTLFYNDFREELIRRSEKSFNSSNHFEAEEYGYFLAKNLHDTIDIYRNIFTPIYFNKNEITQELIDSFASKKTPFVVHTLDMLHGYLTSGLVTDEQKIRAFYIWLITHIEYDYASINGTTHIKNSTFQIIYSGKAVCAGFAHIFLELCELSDIQCAVIIGWAKGASFDLNKMAPNHAWNKVMCNGEWRLIDCTWSSVGNDFFYLTDPGKFVTTHFPNLPDDQLLYPPISVQTFVQLEPLFDE